MTLLSHAGRTRILIPVALVAFAAFGCGSDKKSNPVTPPPPNTAGEFTQVEAIAQSHAAGAQAVSLVQSIPVLAGGFHRHAGAEYGWNEEEQRWEWRHVWDEAGYHYDWFYTVQYLDAGGIPQESASGAASVRHSMTGLGTYHVVTDESDLEYRYEYGYGTTISGVGDENLLMTGDGGWDMDYRFIYGGQVYASSYEVSWRVLDPGLSVPHGGGCPTGSMRYEFAPYYSIITFDGSGTAMATLYDAGGAPVPGGGQTYPLGCTAP